MTQDEKVRRHFNVRVRVALHRFASVDVVHDFFRAGLHSLRLTAAAAAAAAAPAIYYGGSENEFLTFRAQPLGDIF